MLDYTKSMKQTFEYYIVDPLTWKDKELLNKVETCSITRDLSSETLGSASFTITDFMGECYIRVYLIAIQNGKEYKIALGTFLAQSNTNSIGGNRRQIPLDAYTPLIELKEKKPPIGYYVEKKSNIMAKAYVLTKSNVRAPVIKPDCNDILYNDYIAEPDETYLNYISKLIINAKNNLKVDEYGKILFSPIQSTDKLQPIWEYSDDNASILTPDISVSYDIYNMPNVVEVVYSNEIESNTVIVKNEDDSSPISIKNRGREIIHRVVNPEMKGNQDKSYYETYAENLLKELSTVTRKITYTHGYCPVNIGDCVLFNHSKAGLHNIKAKVISQSINCSLGCQVSETAVYTEKLWKE